MAGWQTGYEPRALVGMEVPPTMSALWAQRKRWARGQGEVLHLHMREVFRWRNHRMWLLALESLASPLWVIVIAVGFVVGAVHAVFGSGIDLFGLGMAWGVAISVVSIVQLAVALVLSVHYDRWDLRSILVGAIYPALYWTVSAAAALRSQLAAFIRGPRAQRVVWDVPREERVIS
jgi:poly-beta-1,6-N-acetyl-D-glucosamine synthase